MEIIIRPRKTMVVIGVSFGEVIELVVVTISGVKIIECIVFIIVYVSTTI